MTEYGGIDRAFEVLGDEIARKEAGLRHVVNQRDDLKREAAELRSKNRELTERLKQAEEDRDTACRYALQLEELLEECRKQYAALQEGGGERCKKSQ